MSDPTVIQRDDATPEQFDIEVDGERAGLAAYVDTGDQRIFYHTELDDRFSGRGLGSVLIHAALTETRKEGKRIVPVCPFVAHFVEKHHDFDDLLDPVTPEAKAAATAE
ncbi:GNAT family N-acetyltransferase [Nocardia otitidiscaviarum]|uniref:GNAT family N-acetyltransferase n=1 Tax=Nocardia otitidiscaviarum TaxID=1823 RepID=UPI0018951149|nr:GNAT family N-acetyltransferase [Nocardia otitidiscaviarum]MBF6182849.1 N-acetyltransferase [Nocardia otitidiscaviarum]